MRISRYEIAINKTKYKDERIRAIFKSICSGNKGFWNRKQNTDFCLHYAKIVAEDISWNEMCEFLQDNHAYKVALFFMNELLNNHLYQNEYSELFYNHLSFFDPASYAPTNPLYLLFCFDDIEALILYNKMSDRKLSTKRYYFEYNFADARISSIFKDIASDIRKRDKAPKAFLEKYSQLQVEEISWIELCKDGDYYSCQMFAFYLIYHLLRMNLYHNDYAEYLYRHLDEFKKIYEDPSYTVGTNSHGFMCGEKITGLNILPSVTGKSNVLLLFDAHNPFIKDLFIEFYKYERVTQTPFWYDTDIVWNFEQSFDRYRLSIKSYKDFNEHTFWEQINWFKGEYANDPQKRSTSISCVLQFYRWLVKTKPEYSFFDNALTFSTSLLFMQSVITLIEQDYYFIAFYPENPPLDHDHICFILRGFNRYSTKLKEEDFLGVDLTEIHQPEYRNTFVQYIMSFPSIQLFTGSSPIGYIFEALNFLTSLKAQNDYPNPSAYYFTNQEAVLLRNFIASMNVGVHSKNNRISSIRGFLTWCNNCKIWEFDDLFFSYLKLSSHNRGASNSQAIPDNELSKIVSYMEADSKTNHVAFLCLAITRLLIETKMRIGTICKLTINSILPTMKPNQYRLNSYHKTGYGEPDDSVINDTTYRIIMNVIEETEHLRDACSVTSIHDYIFLKEGSLRDHISPLRVADYRAYLKTVCNAVGVPEYTPSNLRDTHMTKALEFAILHGKSDIELSVLTGHKNIETTKNSYVDWTLEKMLEATYGLDLSDGQYLSKKFNVVDDLPHQFDTNSTVVENGCGHCTATECEMHTNLPCLMCQHFITTTAHEKYFENAIDGIQRMIDCCHGTKHDLEDLISMKKLYVAYLGSILQKKGYDSNE